MSFWKGRRVLITGVCGLIGGHLAKTLVEEGAELVGVDFNGPGTLEWHGIVNQFPVYGIDVCRMQEAVPRLAMEAVFHLAANSGVESARRDPVGSYTTAVLGTTAILEWCRGTISSGSLRAVVVPTSNHVYGEQQSYPVLEGAPLNKLDTYSATKICQSVITRSYAHNYGVPTVEVRNTNCFGPCDPHGGHIVPSAIKALLAGETPVIQGDGKTKKSYLYVQDVVDSYLMLAQWMMTGGTLGEVFNVSNGAISVKGLVRLISEVMGKPDLEPIVLGEPNDQADEWLNSDKIARATGWIPKVQLAEAVLKTADWFAQQRVEAAA